MNDAQLTTILAGKDKKIHDLETALATERARVAAIETEAAFIRAALEFGLNRDDAEVSGRRRIEDALWHVGELVSLLDGTPALAVQNKWFCPKCHGDRYEISGLMPPLCEHGCSEMINVTAVILPGRGEEADRG